jgi:predicted metalloprotease with PDZ domain
MKNLTRFLLLLFVFVIFTNNSFSKKFVSKDEISYTLSIDKNDPKLAKVEVSFVPKDDILYMNPGGNQLPKRWATFVHNLKVSDEKGNAVLVEELPDAKWKMDLRQKQKVILSYEIKLDHENYKWSGGIDGVAFARDWGVFYAGRTLLIFNGEGWKNINVEFKIPENWKVTTPWEIVKNKANSFRVNNLSQLANSLIFAGTHEEVSVKRKNFELVFALGGDEVIAEKEEFKNLAEGVLDYYIDLMGGVPNPAPDNKFKKAVVIINTADATDEEVIGNNISILVEKNGDKTSKMFSRFIFAHEFFHLWNGKSFSPVNDETEWFKEGFTNYYTLKALHYVGFLNDKSYLEVLSSLFYQRYVNDDGVGKISMTKGEEKHDHWGLIYSGGMFIGITQDMIIRKATNNRKSLDDLMKYLFKKYGGSKKEYDLKEIQQKMSELSGKDQTDFYKDYILGTKNLPITNYFEIAGLNAKIEDGNLILSKNESATTLQKNILDGLFGSPK